MTHTAGRVTSMRALKSATRLGRMDEYALTNSRTYTNSGAFVVADVRGNMSRHLKLVTRTRVFMEWNRFTITGHE